MPNKYILSAASIAQLTQEVWQSRKTPLNQQTLEELIAFRSLDLAIQEVGHATVDVLGTPPKTRIIARMIKGLTNNRQLSAGQSTADLYITRLIRQQAHKWTTMLASKETLNPLAMQTKFYLTAIDQMQNTQLPITAREVYERFTLTGLAKMAIDHEKDIKALQQGLAQFKPASDQRTTLNRLNAFTSNFGQQFQNIKNSVQTLQTKVSLNHKDITTLKKQVSALENIAQTHEVRLDDLELVTYAMFEEFKKVDTLGLDKVSKKIASLNEEYLALQSSGASNTLILKKRAELKTSVAELNDKIGELKTYLGWVDGGAKVLTMLGSALGKPELAQAAQVLQGVAQIGIGLVAAFGAGTTATAAGTLAGSALFGPFAPVIAIGTGLVMVYMSFKGSSGGNGIGIALAQISQQIQALSKQIHDLGIHIDNRFDGLENRFDRLEDLLEHLFNRQETLILRSFEHIVSLLDDFRGSIIEAFTDTQNKLENFEVLINMIDDQLKLLEKVTNAGFRELYRQHYTEILLIAHYYDEQKFGEVSLLSQREIRDTIRNFVQWASVNAKNAIFHGDLAADYRLSTLSTIPKTELLNYVNLLLGFVTSQQGYGLTLDQQNLPAKLTHFSQDVDCALEKETSRVVNPNAWKEPAKNLLHLILQTPELKYLPSDICLIEEVIRAGELFLSKTLSLSTNSELFARLTDDYQSNIYQSLERIYLAVATTHEITPVEISQSILDLRNKLASINGRLSSFSEKIEEIKVVLDLIENLVKNSCDMYWTPQTIPGDDDYLISDNTCYRDGEMTLINHPEVKSVFSRTRIPSEQYGLVKAYTYQYKNNNQLFVLRMKNYTNLKDCHANENFERYLYLTNIGNDLYEDPAIQTFKRGIEIAHQTFNEYRETGGVLSRNTSKSHYEDLYQAISDTLPTNMAGNHLASHETKKEKLTTIAETIKQLRKITVCNDFSFIYFDGPWHYKTLLAYKNRKKSYLSTFSTLLTRLELAISEAWQQNNDLYLAFNQYAEELNKFKSRLKLAKYLSLDAILLRDYGSNYQQNTQLEQLPYHQQIVTVLNQWATTHATGGELQKVRQGLLTLLDSANMISLLDKTNQQHHALWLFLSLAFNEAFYSDPIMNEMIRSLWTGDQLVESIQLFNPTDNQTFPMLEFEKSFFPRAGDQSYSLLNLTQGYLNQTIRHNQALAANGTLAPGYLDIHTLLEQLYTVLELIPSPLESSLIPMPPPEAPDETNKDRDIHNDSVVSLTAEQLGLVILGLITLVATVSTIVMCRQRLRGNVYPVDPVNPVRGAFAAPALAWSVEGKLSSQTNKHSFSASGDTVWLDEQVTYHIPGAETKPSSQTNKHSFSASGDAVWLDEQAAYHVAGDGYRAIVLAKQNDSAPALVPKNYHAETPINEDEYNINSCHPINFYNKPSVVCDGNQTTLIYQPTELPAHKHVAGYLTQQGMNADIANITMQLCSDLNGNIMLGQVVYSAVKNIWNSASITFNKWWYELDDQSSETGVIAKNVTETLNQYRARLASYEKFTIHKPWAQFVLTDYEEKLDKLEAKKLVTQNELDELKLDLEAFEYDLGINLDIETSDQNASLGRRGFLSANHSNFFHHAPEHQPGNLDIQNQSTVRGLTHA